MADIRINALATTATTPASDDYLALDGAAQGTRKILATNIANNVTDVILGTSGPSVKASLSARAPRQGLVFDGTAGSSGTLGSIPSGTWTVSAVIDVPTSNPAANLMALTMGIGYGVAGGGSFVLGDINTSGNLTISQWAGTFPAYREATISGFRAAYSGKRVHLAAVITGGALTVYINGVATSYTEASGAGAPAWGDALGSANVFVGKGQTSLYYFSGSIYAPLIYNRALSASEVVALYEAGAPAGADYNSASNTSVVTGFSNGGYTTFSGASATGFTAAAASGSNYVVNTPAGNTQPVLQVGSRVRVSFTATLTSGAAPTFGIRNNVGGDEGTFTVAAGSNSVIITMTQKSVSDGLGNAVFRSTGATSYAISNFSLTYLGLLLAPDAAQAGGGLTWYDTSGNAANITLPASGVSWNVPTSGYVTSGGVLNLLAGGSNKDVVITPSGTGIVNFGPASASSYSTFWENASSANGLQAVRNGVTFSTPLTLQNRGGNVLIGTTTDSANGKLQLATHTTSAGGIGFGTDVSLYRESSVKLTANSTGSSLTLALAVGGTQKAIIASDGTTAYLGATAAGGSTILYSGNAATALTLDSSQNATFAGKVTVNGTDGLLVNKSASLSVITMGEGIAGSYSRFNMRTGSAKYAWSIGAQDLVDNALTIAPSTAVGGTTFTTPVLTVAQSGAVTVSGAIAIGNTVQTAASVASTHKVTISIGGTTYYLLATNV